MAFVNRTQNVATSSTPFPNSSSPFGNIFRTYFTYFTAYMLVNIIFLSYVRPIVLFQYSSYMIIKFYCLCINMCIIDLNYLLHFGIILIKIS